MPPPSHDGHDLARRAEGRARETRVVDVVVDVVVERAAERAHERFVLARVSAAQEVWPRSDEDGVAGARRGGGVAARRHAAAAARGGARGRGLGARV
jgi:hypothetical protein